jgi:hypothetical protein
VNACVVPKFETTGGGAVAELTRAFGLGGRFPVKLVIVSIVRLEKIESITTLSSKLLQVQNLKLVTYCLR